MFMCIHDPFEANPAILEKEACYWRGKGQQQLLPSPTIKSAASANIKYSRCGTLTYWEGLIVGGWGGVVLGGAA